jgi:hypothetical protein
MAGCIARCLRGAFSLTLRRVLGVAFLLGISKIGLRLPAPTPKEIGLSGRGQMNFSVCKNGELHELV